MDPEQARARLSTAAETKQRTRRAAARAQDAWEDAVEAALRAGIGPAEVARASGCGYEVIRRIARARGIERRNEPRGITDVQDDDS